MEKYVNGESDFFNGGLIMVGSSSPSRSPLPISSPPSASVASGADGRVNAILHTVSKFDTLAGVAIKYGVEVADIKKLNGLVTDLQMFGLKTLQIPLPGRHPPSPILSISHDTPQGPRSSDHSQSSRRHSDLFDSFQSLKLKSCSEQKVSVAMSSFQGYYGLNPPDQSPAAEGCEMAVYQKGGAHYLEDGPQFSPTSNPPLSRHRKSRSVANGFGSVNGDLIHPLLSQEGVDREESDRWFVKLLGRSEKSLADLTTGTPEKLLKEESSSSSSLISPVTGKGLALRPKSGNLNPNPVVGFGDCSSIDSSSNGVRKSSSTPSLQQDSENGGTSSSIWPTSKWSLKPDFQALSTAAIGRPIFDGLPKHMGRRNKAALD